MHTVGESGLRVLHVLAEVTRSGAESMLLTSVSDFRANGYESDVLSTGDAPGPMASEFEAAGFGVHHIPFSKTPAFFIRVYQLMRRGRYDVIHLHTERANVWLGLVALAARPPRTVRTVHTVFGFEGSLRRRRGIQRRALERLGVVHVACGPAVQRNELKRFGLRTRLAPSWYDSRSFAPASRAGRARARTSLGIDDRVTVVVSTGTCAPVKNHGALLEAIARLPEDERPLYLHIGTEEPGQPERRLADELGIASSVRFLGAVEDVSDLYAACDVYVMPSRYEGFSVAALEALAAGLPTLLTDVGGLRDLRGLFASISYAEPTAESLAQALSGLLALTPEDRRARAAGYAEITREVFGIEPGVDRYLEIYRGGGRERDEAFYGVKVGSETAQATPPAFAADTTARSQNPASATDGE